MKKRLIKLAGGRVVPFRADRMAKQLKDSAVDEQRLTQPDSNPTTGSQTNQTSSASYSPHSQVLDPQVLEGSEVVVIGAGAIGSYITYFLAAMTSLIIHLIDFDVVDLKHTHGGRTIYESSHVHKKKVYAAKEKIERAYPLSRIIPYCYNIVELPDIVLTRLAGKAAIVINAIDDAAAMLRINDIFYSLVEVLFVALHSAGASGHIILTVPYVSACLRCALDITSADGIHTLHSEPALGADFRSVANQCSIIALEIMHAKVTGKPIERWDLSKTVFYFANRRERHSPDGPGVVLQRVNKRPGCPVCSAASR